MLEVRCNAIGNIYWQHKSKKTDHGFAPPMAGLDNTLNH